MQREGDHGCARSQDPEHGTEVHCWRAKEAASRRAQSAKLEDMLTRTERESGKLDE
jgi:hypothetical protein